MGIDGAWFYVSSSRSHLSGRLTKTKYTEGGYVVLVFIPFSSIRSPHPIIADGKWHQLLCGLHPVLIYPVASPELIDYTFYVKQIDVFIPFSSIRSPHQQHRHHLCGHYGLHPVLIYPVASPGQAFYYDQLQSRSSSRSHLSGRLTNIPGAWATLRAKVFIPFSSIRSPHLSEKQHML